MLRPEAYRWLHAVGKHLHRAQAKALIAVVCAVVLCGKLRSCAVAQELAGRSGTKFKSAVQRFYRWVKKSKLDELLVWAAIAERTLAGAGRHACISIDWTEWRFGKRILVAAVARGRRALPIFAQTFSKTNLPRSQNSRENAFCTTLGLLSPLVKRAVLLADRGFRRASLIKLLLAHQFRFVVRLAAKVTVQSAEYQGLLSAYPLRPGQWIDLGVCRLRSDQVVQVRVVGVWAVGQKEPWWLATSLTNGVRRVAEYYDRRMSIEEQFRDTKGCRFGTMLAWTHFQQEESINRLFLLTALALVLWLAAGWWACQQDDSLRWPSKAKGPRRSFSAIGRAATAQLVKLLRCGWRTILRLLPPTQPRSFAWCTKK